MRSYRIWFVLLPLLGNCVVSMKVADVGAREIGRKSEMQAAAAFQDGMAAGKAPPFSFRYGSQESAGLLEKWQQSVKLRKLDERRTERTVTYSDPKTGLKLQVVAVLYHDFPAVEWVLYLENTGSSDTPILEDILPLDAHLAMPSDGPYDPIVHYSKGALACIDDFAPVQKKLEPGAEIHLEPGGGRSSSEFLPFFNLDLGTRGVVTAVGWTGQWAATFGREEDGRLRLRAGMATTHLKLHPGERIRTPRILTLFWEGRRIRGHNLLRRFILTHHRPHPGGKPLVLPVTYSAWGGRPAAEHLKNIEQITRHDLPIELYWIDAEWFGQTPWFKHNGNWEVRGDLYPQGFKPISDSLHRAGRRFLLWFEPQRVCRGTPWYEFTDRHGWLLELGNGDPRYKQRDLNWGIPHHDPRWILYESHRSQISPGDRLWNMGHPQARRFLTDFISSCVEEFGLDWYREDFNIAPLEYWQHADPPDRRGMAEIRYIEGLYAMWDELLQRHPHLAIDNCSSGGRRIDLETIGRSTPLWRTDWPIDALHKQCHTHGLMYWLPLHMTNGAVPEEGNEYEMRSAMTAGFIAWPHAQPVQGSESAQKLLRQYLDVQKYYYGEYYPLTPYSQAADVWMAYQLHLPEDDEGLVVVLKRPQSPHSEAAFPLSGLRPDGSYRITNLDTARSRTLAGRQLLDTGLQVQLENKPDSALIRYDPLE